jgi:uncharacterized protein (DUF1015 family)
MAVVEPFQALRYDQLVAGPLQDLVAPPYDVIDAGQRERLAARAAHNVVRVDLPMPSSPAVDRYDEAAATFAAWRSEGAVVAEEAPALWALSQHYTGPDGAERTRRGFFARVRVEDYGAGRIRPHERTHPGPKQDRLRLTRATRANLSPIFALYSDPQLRAWSALAPHTQAEPWGETVDDDGTRNRLWRIADADAIAAVRAATDDAELLIADGHHRYETARAYADEIGGEGPHRYVLANLVALQDEGLTVFPTHRLVSNTTAETQEALAETIRASFDVERITLGELPPSPGDGPLTLGYLDSHFKQPLRLTLKDQAIADQMLAEWPEPYRHLDTAVLETLLLQGPLALSDDDIDHQRGLSYSRTDAEARDAVLAGDVDVAFFLRPPPVSQVQQIAAAGVNMPPKSTFFFPKVPTGLLFHALA